MLDRKRGIWLSCRLYRGLKSAVNMVRGSPECKLHLVRTYEDTIKALNSLQTNAAVLEQIRKSRGGRMQTDSLPEMAMFLEKLNIQVSDLDVLNVIHVSGTKGKGSVCAFSECILRNCGLKTGFYSSPHLVEVRERIRINGNPLEKEKFTEYFWQCLDRLEASSSDCGGKMPAYFRFLTLLAYYVFLREKVDVAVMEVGVGGAYDCTNIIRSPVVCGITMLGLEHTSVLGNTIERIAWHKSGIMKPGRPVVTIPQTAAAMDTLKEREKELKANLTIAPPLESYENELPALGLEGSHQRYNASLALQLCRIWLADRSQLALKHGLSYLNGLMDLSGSLSKDTESEPPMARPFHIPQPFLSGMQKVKWPGRNQVILRKQIAFYLDGAHTVESLQACAEWFNSRKDNDVKLPREEVFRVLVFNCTGDRSAHTLLKPLTDIDFDYAVFLPSILEANNSKPNHDQTNFTVTRDKQLAWCTQNQLAWLAMKGLGISSSAASAIDTNSSHVAGTSLQSSEHSSVFSSISEGIRWISSGKDPDIEKPCPGGPEVPSRLAMAEHVQILITGSLHLVGGIMKFLGPDIAEVV